MTIKEAKELFGEKYVQVYQFALSIGAPVEEIFLYKIDIKGPPKINDGFIDRFLKLWPPPKVTGLDYSVGGQKAEVRKRFTKLLKLWSKITDKEWNEDKIIDATKAYLSQQRSKNWAYTMKSYNFVLNGEVSVLVEFLDREPVKEKNFFL